jgi:hypothetical protein
MSPRSKASAFHFTVSAQAQLCDVGMKSITHLNALACRIWISRKDAEQVGSANVALHFALPGVHP